MRVVVQRVRRARVDVEQQCVGRIETGLLLLVGIGHGDGPAEADWMARKIAGLRIFADDDGKMNLSVLDVGGACLAVSQFTLYGDCLKGFRPGFSAAAPPVEGIREFDRFVGTLRSTGVEVGTGDFGADMRVELVNDGPVTLVLEREPS